MFEYLLDSATNITQLVAGSTAEFVNLALGVTPTPEVCTTWACMAIENMYGIGAVGLATTVGMGLDDRYGTQAGRRALQWTRNTAGNAPIGNTARSVGSSLYNGGAFVQNGARSAVNATGRTVSSTWDYFFKNKNFEAVAAKYADFASKLEARHKKVIGALNDDQMEHLLGDQMLANPLKGQYAAFNSNQVMQLLDGLKSWEKPAAKKLGN